MIEKTENNDNFVERPKQNERERALNYVAKLIDKASHDKATDQGDINELLEIQRLLNGKRYGLVWEEHDEKVEETLKTKIPIFKDKNTKKISDGDGKYNFLLEGDNLYTLHLLNKTHKGKIDFIYIDPPYNTGNKDFKYNDQFIKSDDAYVHSKWLSFMELRLRSAKSLLSENGVIAVSIDNHEGYQLKLLMDEIFGEDHMAADLHIETSAIAGPRRIPALNGSVVKTTEFVFVYTVGSNKIMRRPMYDGIHGFDTHYSKFVSTETGTLVNFTEILRDTPRIANIFDSYNHMKVSLTNLDKLIRIDKDLRDWVFSEAISKRLFRLSGKFNNKQNVELKKSINKINGKYVMLDEKGNAYTGFRYFDRIGQTNDYYPSYMERTIRGNLWKGFSSDGGNLSKEGGVHFKNGKKPLRLIKQLICSMTPDDKPITVLDFFAGSGTTGEAVMQLNAEGKGHYNFILATNDEVVDITYKRMLNTNKQEPLNLKYFSTSFVNKDSDNLEHELLNNVKTLIELQYGIDFDDSSFAMVIKRNEVSKLNLRGITKVFMRGRVHIMMSPAERSRYYNAGVEIVDIPENYFGKELQGWI